MSSTPTVVAIFRTGCALVIPFDEEYLEAKEVRLFTRERPGEPHEAKCERISRCVFKGYELDREAIVFQEVEADDDE